MSWFDDIISTIFGKKSRQTGAKKPSKEEIIEMANRAAAVAAIARRQKDAPKLRKNSPVPAAPKGFTPTIRVDTSPAGKVISKISKIDRTGSLTKAAVAVESIAREVSSSVKSVGSVATVATTAAIGGIVGGPAGAAVGAAAGAGAVVGGAAMRGAVESQGYSSSSPVAKGAEFIGGFAGSIAGSEAAISAIKRLVPAKITTVSSARSTSKSSTMRVGYGVVKHPLVNKGKPRPFTYAQSVDDILTVEKQANIQGGKVVAWAKMGHTRTSVIVPDELTVASVERSKSPFVARGITISGKRASITIHGSGLRDTTTSQISAMPNDRAIFTFGKGKSNGVPFSFKDFTIFEDITSSKPVEVPKGRITTTGIRVFGGGGTLSKAKVREVSETVKAVIPSVTKTVSREISTTATTMRAVLPVTTTITRSATWAKAITITIPAPPKTQELEKTKTKGLSVAINLPRLKEMATTRTKTIAIEATLPKLKEKIKTKTATNVATAITDTVSTKSQTKPLAKVASLSMTVAPQAVASPSNPFARVTDILSRIRVPRFTLSGYSLGRASGANRGKARGYKYAPSVVALMENIRAKAPPKVLTGFEIRPIVGSVAHSKKKKKRKKATRGRR